MGRWRELRFSDVNSEGYRRGVAKLATRLVDANKHAEEVSVLVLPKENNAEIESSDQDQEPGFIDSLAVFEEELNKSPNTLTEISEEITLIGTLMREATAEITGNTMPNLSFANRVTVMRRLAQQLQKPVDRIWTLGNELSTQLHSIDSGYRILIERIPIEVEKDPTARESVCKFFDSIHTMATASDEALQSVQHMINATEPLDKMSRDLRPLMRRLRQGLTLMMELKGLSQDWLNLIETSNIECDDVVT